MRGRLIQIFRATFARLDTDATETAGRYDEDFREIRKVDTDGDGIGDTGRIEHPEITLNCQLGNRTFEALQMVTLGNVPQNDMVLWLFIPDLVQEGLIDETTRRCLLGIGTRLVRIENRLGQLELTIPNPPGLFVTEARISGPGLNMAFPQANLYRLELRERSASR